MFSSKIGGHEQKKKGLNEKASIAMQCRPSSFFLLKDKTVKNIWR